MTIRRRILIEIAESQNSDDETTTDACERVLATVVVCFWLCTPPRRLVVPFSEEGMLMLEAAFRASGATEATVATVELPCTHDCEPSDGWRH